MKMITKMLVTVVFLSGMGFGAVAQNAINLAADSITLKTPNSVNRKINLMSANLNIGSAESVLKCVTSYCTDFIVRGQKNGAGSIDGQLFANSARIYNNLNVGTINSLAPKAFIHPHPTEESTVIKYVAMESGEALTVARGTAKTVNGQVTIALPEHFTLVTSKDEPITVILTPEGAPVLLYTKQKNREKIMVAMKPSDFSEYKDIEFSYQVTGIRDGFEDLNVIIDEKELDAVPTKEYFEKNDVMKRIKAISDKAAARHTAERE
ncbi:MAG: hypothetical protein FWB85_02935 [Chitinispirillia bacterium]|nr:hypothetical protein [Chitinispirillia bacterium]